MKKRKKMSKIDSIKASKFYYDDKESNPDKYVLIADFDKREVTTNCGDYYYDISIDFDDFIKFARHIEEQDKIFNKAKKCVEEEND